MAPLAYRMVLFYCRCREYDALALGDIDGRRPRSLIPVDPPTHDKRHGHSLHQRWVRLKVTDGKSNSDVTLPLFVLSHINSIDIAIESATLKTEP